jgi:hypothetical protein
VQREAHMSASTQVRRLLSPFVVVLSIEAPVAVFLFSYEALEHISSARVIGLMIAI